MAQIDIPADEDTGGIPRLSGVSESPESANGTGDLVITPVNQQDLADRGLGPDGVALNGASNGSSRPVTANGYSNGKSSGRKNGSLNGSAIHGSPNGAAVNEAHDGERELAEGEFAEQATDQRDAPDQPTATVDEASSVAGTAPLSFEASPSPSPLPSPTPYDDLVAKAPPLRPYIEDPTGPVVSPGPFDPRQPGGETQVLPVSAVPAASAEAVAPTIRPGVRLRRRPRPRVRRVNRVIRSIDTWTVFKVSLIFYLAMYVIFLVASVLLWRVANATGTLENIQTFLTHYGWESFKFRGGEIYHAVWIIGLFLVVAGVGLNVTMATLFNLIADLVGGIRVTVLEEEVRLRPRLQITKAIVPRPAKATPTPGEPLMMPDGPPVIAPVDASGDQPRDYSSEILWIAPSSEVTETTLTQTPVSPVSLPPVTGL